MLPGGLNRAPSGETIVSTPEGKAGTMEAATPSSLCRGVSGMSISSPQTREELLRAPTLKFGSESPLTPTQHEPTQALREVEVPDTKEEQSMAEQESQKQPPHAEITGEGTGDNQPPVADGGAENTAPKGDEVGHTKKQAEQQAVGSKPKQPPIPKSKPAEQLAQVGNPTKVPKVSMYEDGSYWKSLG